MNIVKATMDALQQLETPSMAVKRRGVSLKHLFGQDL